MQCDTVWKNARLLTMEPAVQPFANGVVGARDGKIVFVGSESDAPIFHAKNVISCNGRWLTPGLIDPHTHLVYAGNRVAEFEQRLNGISYEEISRRGGGIKSTMRATRDATEVELVSTALPRLDALIAEGVTTVEIKSGYGLTVADELKMLRAARSLAHHRQVDIRTTFLGAHALPPEFAGRSDEYIDLVCYEMIPAVAREGLADAVDAFCEGIGFTVEQTQRVFATAQDHGLPIKLHAEQLSNQHGAALAASRGALSADHLEYLDESGVSEMARAGTVATLLPGAYYFTREQRLPPIAALRAAGVPIALATDCNPGTSPLTSLLLVMNMAATLFQLTIDECLAGVTREAARALGLSDRIGTLAVGKLCDLAIWNIESPAELVYRMGFNPIHDRIWRGKSSR